VEVWNELLRVALLGTERQGPTLLPSGGALGEVLSKLKPDDRERTLLAAAATISIYRGAGKLASKGKAPESPAPADVLPRCSPRSAQHLIAMLDGTHDSVLGEWLTAAAAAKKRIPEERIPALLDRGAHSEELRDGVTHVLGRRGVWLAAQNPAWSFVGGSATTEVDEQIQVWETGDRAARVAVLRRMRGCDPGKAREMVQSTWKQDAPDDRAEFVAEFNAGLSAADEPFLEELLDDKRKEVRNAAVELLARLPESKWVQRMTERVRPLLSYTAAKKGLMAKLSKSGPKIEVTLPAECDTAMLRDGVGPKPPAGEKIGEKAWWLQQMLASVPPEFWAKTWGATPEEILQASKGEWFDLLLQGWTTATVRYRDVTWARMLVEKHPETVFLGTAVIEILPASDREKLTLIALKEAAFKPVDGSPAQALLKCCKHPWSAELGRAVLKALRTSTQQAHTQKERMWELRTALPEFARYMPPNLHTEAADGWRQDTNEWDYWRESVDKFLSLLQFRHDMLESLNEK
jgi:hypothetical protein